jgi:hypothetical protein
LCSRGGKESNETLASHHWLGALCQNNRGALQWHALSGMDLGAHQTDPQGSTIFSSLFSPRISEALTIRQVSSENLDAFEQIIKTYASIAQPFARFKTYNAMYPKDLDVQKALSLFYADILRFHKNAYNLVRRGGWHILFATSCGRFQRQFQHIFDDLKAHEALIDKTANAAGLQGIRSLLESMQLDQEARKEAAARKEEELVASQLAQIITLLRVDDSHQLNLLETILNKAGEIVGSGGWAIKQPRIQSWASRTEQTKFLVLHGHPGTGKSVLSARIARFLQPLVDAVVIAHFCTYIYPESTRYEDLLRFILLRLIRKSPELITYAYHDLFVRKWAPSSAVLEELLIRLLSAAGPSQSQMTYIHLIVDGLNECSENIQTRVFKFFQKLVASSSSQIVLKALLVTRTDETNSAISKALKGKHQVSLAEEKDQLREDIRLYVQSALGTLRPKLRDLRLHDKDTDCLSTQIVDRADGMLGMVVHACTALINMAGMILWAKLVLQSISSNFLYSREEVFEAAKTFPRELSQLCVYPRQHALNLYTNVDTDMVRCSRAQSRDSTKGRRLDSVPSWAGLPLLDAHSDIRSYCLP